MRVQTNENMAMATNPSYKLLSIHTPGYPRRHRNDVLRGSSSSSLSTDSGRLMEPGQPQPSLHWHLEKFALL
jgi:hypothetical protein